MPTFAESAYRYCMARNDGWMRGLLDRFEAALPEAPALSVRYEKVDTMAAVDENDVLQDGKRDVVLRVTGPWRGEPAVQLAAIGPIDPTTCEVGVMRGQVGWDVSTPPEIRFAVP